MSAARGEQPDRARRDRVRRTLLKLLKPIQHQEDDPTGCMLVVVAYPLLVGVCYVFFDRTLLASLGWAVLAWLAPLASFGYYVDIAARRAKTRAYEMFEMTYAPGSPRRELAISVLGEIAREDMHSHRAAATHLLTELGEGGLTVPSPEGQLDDALDEVERAAPEDHAPIEWNAPQETAPERDSAPERQRYDHIPLEPEDPEGRR